MNGIDSRSEELSNKAVRQGPSISIGGPVQALQVFSQMGDGSKPVQNQRPLEPTANFLHCAGHFGVSFGPSQNVIKYPDQFANILLARFLFRDGTVEQVQQFDLEFQPEPVDDDIVSM